METFIPYEFVFDYLPDTVIIKKMFGMHYVYLGRRIMLILRNRRNQPEFNGVWVATSIAHHDSLRKEVPELGPFFLAGNERRGNWLLIQGDSNGFEEAAIKVCDLISRGDPRIGNVTEHAPL